MLLRIRRHAGIEPKRRAGVHVAQGPSLGKAQAEEGQIDRRLVFRSASKVAAKARPSD
jgi:hypothetical protein